MREVDRKVEMQDNGAVLITRVIEEQLTVDELELRKRDIQRQKENLVNQSVDIKERYDALDAEEKEYDRLIEDRQSGTMSTQSVTPDEPIVIGETDTSVTTLPREMIQGGSNVSPTSEPATVNEAEVAGETTDSATDSATNNNTHTSQIAEDHTDSNTNSNANKNKNK